MRFTQQEFDIMVSELLYREKPSFDMLCKIAEKTVSSSVKRWCYEDTRLRGRSYEDDVMQNVYLKLMKTTVNGFLLNERANGGVNNDPEGFEDWMFTVAKNEKRKVADKVQTRDKREGKGTEGDPPPPPPPTPIDDDNEERVERLKQAVSVVLSSNVSVYKVLAWMAQLIFIIDRDITKIESNDLVVSAFEDKTLSEMYEMILLASRRIPWLVITKEQNEKILEALRKKYDENILYGEVKFKDFFMMQNGEKSGKKSLSDWANRMNGIIKRGMNEDSDEAEKKSKKKTSGDTEEKKGRNEDESSDI